MAMKRCPVCGERYSDTYKNCPFCEEDEYWEEEEDTRRPLLREGGRSSRSRSPYGIVTPILIVLIVLMAALLVYLLYGDKIADKFSKDPDTDKPGIQTPQTPEPTPTPAPSDGTTPDGDAEPSGGDASPDDGEMPEGNSGASGNAGSTGNTSSGGTSGGMSYASAAALPSGLTLSTTDFTEPASTGTVKLRVSGGTGSYTWISENPSIATVASDGTVTLVAKGTTNVVVTDGTKKAICIVRVSSGPSPSSTGSSGTTSSGTTSSGTTSSGTTSSGTTSSGTTSSGTTSGGSLKAGNAVVINGGNGVRVRSGPSTNHDILATIPNGGSVRIVESAGNDWYKITFSGVGGVTTTGYMKGEFLSNS